MKNLEKNKDARGDSLLFLALLFLVNPSVHVVDIFPDFIAYFIILKRISYAADRAPYFAEAKSAISKLLLISLFKLPAYFVILFARSGNVGDTDVYALFAFAFAAVEAIYLVIAVYYLFEGAFYLGQRTSAISLIRPFYINKKKTRTASPDTLRRFLYFFAVYKCAAYGLPELLLLTKVVTKEQLRNYFNITSLYPYTILFAIISVIILGIIVLRRTYAYIKQTENATDLRESLNSLVEGEARIKLENKAKVKDISLILGMITVSTIFMIDIRLDNFSQVNINPHFFMGIILLFIIHKMKKFVGKCTAAKIALGLFIISSGLVWIMEVNFLSEYSFSLLASSGLVKRKFAPILFVSLAELAFFALAIILFGKKLLTLQKLHTLGEPEDSARKQRYFVIGYIATTVTVGIMKYVGLLLRYFAKNMIVNFENDGLIDIGVVTEPMIPWFNAAVIAITVILVFYTHYVLSSVKEEVELKYS